MRSRKLIERWSRQSPRHATAAQDTFFSGGARLARSTHPAQSVLSNQHLVKLIECPVAAIGCHKGRGPWTGVAPPSASASHRATAPPRSSLARSLAARSTHSTHRAVRRRWDLASCLSLSRRETARRGGASFTAAADSSVNQFAARAAETAGGRDAEMRWMLR